MNAITITGNLVADPESRSLGPDRGKVTNFRIANNELVRGEQVLNGYFDVSVFGAQADHVLKLKKGERVVVSGRLQHSTFEREDGTRGARTRLVANEIGLSMLFEGAFRPAAQPATTAEPIAVDDADAPF